MTHFKSILLLIAALTSFAHAEENSSGKVFFSHKGKSRITVYPEGGYANVRTPEDSFNIRFQKQELLDGDFFITDKGDRVIWVSKKTFSGQLPFEKESELIVLRFFKGSHAIKYYTLRELVPYSTFITRAVGKTFWSKSAYLFPTTNDFELETLGLTKYIFNTQTGEIKFKDIHDPFEEAEYVVEGRLDVPGFWGKLIGKGSILTVTNWIKGTGPQELAVNIEDERRSGTVYNGRFILEKHDKNEWEVTGSINPY